jgi:urease accessory protein
MSGRAVLSAILLAASVSAALAHPPPLGVTGFTGGLIHPLFVPAHAMALVGLGLLIAQQGFGRSVAAAAAIGLVAGLGALWLAFVPRLAAEAVLVCAALAGLALAWGRAWPEPEARVLALVAGFAIGLDSPPEVVSLSVANRMLLGTGIGATALLLLAVFAGQRLAGADAPLWRRTGIRVIGSWIAAAAALVLALRFTV